MEAVYLPNHPELGDFHAALADAIGTLLEKRGQARPSSAPQNKEPVYEVTLRSSVVLDLHDVGLTAPYRERERTGGTGCLAFERFVFFWSGTGVSVRSDVAALGQRSFGERCWVDTRAMYFAFAFLAGSVKYTVQLTYEDDSLGVLQPQEQQSPLWVAAQQYRSSSRVMQSMP